MHAYSERVYYIWASVRPWTLQINRSLYLTLNYALQTYLRIVTVRLHGFHNKTTINYNIRMRDLGSKPNQNNTFCDGGRAARL